VELVQASGHDGLDQAMLKSIEITKRLTLPADDCLKKRANFIRSSLYYDESDLSK
jgi:hypothetical protein